MFKLLKKKRGGFTLIELLVVVAVIGILASVILVGVAAFRGRARDARRISDLRQVQNALELYFTKEGNYPDTSDWPTLSSLLIAAGIGINQIPVDPTASQSYGYCQIDSTRYVLGAKLEAANPALDETYGDGCDPAGITCDAVSRGYCVTI